MQGGPRALELISFTLVSLGSREQGRANDGIVGHPRKLARLDGEVTELLGGFGLGHGEQNSARYFPDPAEQQRKAGAQTPCCLAPRPGGRSWQTIEFRCSLQFE